MNLNMQPYYDDYNRNKGYTQIVAIPGRVAQAREFTQVQTMILDFINRLGGVLIKNGSVVEGCSLNISGDTATVSNGKIYFNGIVHDFVEDSVTITGIGVEDIGVKLNETIVTEADDPTLRDPAVGYDNYSQPGAYRVRTTLSLVLNDSSAVSIYRLDEGLLTTLQERPQLDIVGDLLARRTYDEEGNYKVSGLKLWTEVRSGLPYLNIESGKAYIQGYEVVKPASVRIALDKSTDTRTVLGEPKVYSTGTAMYSLNNSPVAHITRVQATVQVTKSITRGNINGGSDLLPNTPVVSIVSVSQGGTTYVNGSDFQLTADSVDWSLPGAEPAIGSTYNVTFQHTKQMMVDTDFHIAVVGGVSKVNFDVVGSNPVDGTTFYTDYDYYLARKDVVLLDKNGAITLLRGQSDVAKTVAERPSSGLPQLKLGYVYLPPNSDECTAYTESINRSSMADIQSLAERLSNMEYNIALSDLDKAAMSGQSPTQLKGILSEGFIDISKADMGKAGFDAGFDFELNELTLPSNQDIYSCAVNSAGGTAKISKVLATNQFTQKSLIKQPLASGSMLINPYAVYDQLALITPSPAYDNWVDTSNVTIQNTQITNLGTVRRWWVSSHRSESKNWWERLIMQQLGLTTAQMNAGGATLTSVSQRVFETAVDYIRTRDIVVTGQNFMPYADNLKCTFDGVSVPLTPLDDTLAGTAAGSVQAKADGTLKASFTIPSGIRTGTRVVEISNTNNDATSTYDANGIQRVIEETITTNTVRFSPYDPLAETFTVPSDCFLTSLGLFFTAKDPSKNVVVQIKNVVNGYPGDVILAEKVLLPSQITSSANASVETVVTFDDPIHLSADQQYSFAVLSTSNVYALGIAELGKSDMVSGAVINKQPYTDGVMFSSSNAQTWTAHQTMDLKFSLYKASFSPQSTLLFNQVGVAGKNYDRSVLMALSSAPVGTHIDWVGSTDGGTTFKPIVPLLDVESPAYFDTMIIKAILNGTEDLSPMVNIDGLTVSMFKNKTAGTYYSRLVTLTTPYTSVTQVLDISTPSGSSVSVQFTYDDGATWINPTQGSPEQIDQTFTRYTFTGTTGGTGKTTFRARINLATTNTCVRPRVKRFLNIMN